MSKYLTFFLILAFVASTYAYNNGDDKKFGYIGSEKCGMCHKKDDSGNQLKVWQASAHAMAYKNLAKADAEAVKNAKCLTCHATGAGSDAALNDKKFSVEDGVQCEACHGPGSEYKSLKVMKDRAASVAAGLVVWENEKAIEAQCMTCHDMGKKKAASDKHKDKKFDFASMYAKIKHNKPAK